MENILKNIDTALDTIHSESKDETYQKATDKIIEALDDVLTERQLNTTDAKVQEELAIIARAIATKLNHIIDNYPKFKELYSFKGLIEAWQPILKKYKDNVSKLGDEDKDAPVIHFLKNTNELVVIYRFEKRILAEVAAAESTSTKDFQAKLKEIKKTYAIDHPHLKHQFKKIINASIYPNIDRASTPTHSTLLSNDYRIPPLELSLSGSGRGRGVSIDSSPGPSLTPRAFFTKTPVDKTKRFDFPTTPKEGLLVKALRRLSQPDVKLDARYAKEFAGSDWPEHLFPNVLDIFKQDIQEKNATEISEIYELLIKKFVTTNNGVIDSKNQSYQVSHNNEKVSVTKQFHDMFLVKAREEVQNKLDKIKASRPYSPIHGGIYTARPDSEDTVSQQVSVLEALLKTLNFEEPKPKITL
jgi:hypothetical protein